MSVLIQLAVGFGLLSFVAIGGANTLLGTVHANAVARGWVDDATFTQIVALAQVAPGPNFMFIPLLGWSAAGAAGAAVALVAFTFPPSVLAVAVARAMRRHGERPIVAAFRAALRPIAAGVLAGAGLVIAIAFARTRLVDIVVVILVAILAARARINVLWWIAGAAALGAITTGHA